MLTYGDSYFSDISCSDEDYDLINKGFDDGKNLKDFSDILDFNPVSPENILAITFTNKAAKEMVQRLSAMVGEDKAKKMWIGTFHSISGRILRTDIAEYKDENGKSYDNKYHFVL